MSQLRCPECGVAGRTHVPKTKRYEDYTLRYRVCDACGYHFKTHEYVAPPRAITPGPPRKVS